MAVEFVFVENSPMCAPKEKEPPEQGEEPVAVNTGYIAVH